MQLTEDQWLRSKHIEQMVSFLGGRLSKRKLDLFVAACCRRFGSATKLQIRPLMTDPRVTDVIEVIERIADGAASITELKVAESSFWKAVRHWDACNDPELNHAAHTVSLAHHVVAGWDWDFTMGFAGNISLYSSSVQPPKWECELLRCVIGNPFRLLRFDLSWQTNNVVGITQATYEDRSLPSGLLYGDRLAILADALEDAGCDNADIIDHLRSPGPHVRGCWPLDLILGKH